MSNKFSTEKLKELISQWFSDPHFQNFIKECYVYDDDICDGVKDNPNYVNSEKFKEDFQEVLDRWDNPKGINTLDDFANFIVNEWCGKNKWKRFGKRQLKDDWENYFDKTDFIFDSKKQQHVYLDKEIPILLFDCYGWYDEKLVDHYYNNPDLAQKCIERCFVPTNQNIRDNYYLVIITTPEDDQVIGWLLHHD